MGESRRSSPSNPSKNVGEGNAGVNLAKSENSCFYATTMHDPCTRMINECEGWGVFIATKKFSATSHEKCHSTILMIKLFRRHDFFLNKLLRGPRKVKLRHLWLRWSWPNVPAYQNFWSTMWHPLVAKFSNMCYFYHFLRVRWKRSPQSTGLPWKI